jgi:hypothetical protein
VIINNANVPSVLAVPTEANPKLVVDADAPPALAVAFQLLQTIARGLQA